MRAWWIDLVVALALAIAFAIVGVILAPTLGVAMLRGIGVTTLYFRSPADVGFAGLGTAFAIPPLATLATGAIDRYRGTPPSWARLAVYLVVATLAIALGLIVNVVGMRTLLDDYGTGIQPMITVDSFELGGTAWRSGIAGALVLAGFAAMRRRWPWSRPA